MSLYPAATALKIDDGSRKTRQSMRAGWSSPLYIAHKDITRLLDHPNTIQEIINGTQTGSSTDTETQYCVRLGVPSGARIVNLYWYAQVLLSATTGSLDTVTLTLASTSTVRLQIYGRFPDAESTTAYTATNASLTNALALDSLGAWRTIGQVTLATGTGSGLTLLQASTANPGFHAPVLEVSTTRRVAIGNISSAQLALAEISSPFMVRQSLGASNSSMNNDTTFGWPLMGATEIIVAPMTGGGTPNPSVAATGTSISSVDFVAIAASFHA
jgi:hypothetical protein